DALGIEILHGVLQRGGRLLQSLREGAEARLDVALLADEGVVRATRDRVGVEGRLAAEALERTQGALAAKLAEDEREVGAIRSRPRPSVVRLEHAQPSIP